MNEVVPMPPARVPPEPAAGAAAGGAADQAAERQKRLEAARRRRKATRSKPIWFVLCALVAWWFLAMLADVVITCVPGGAPCRVPQLIVSVSRYWDAIRSGTVEITGSAATAALTRYEWPLLILSLLAALWVARAAVYPYSDTDEFTEEELDGKE